MKRCGGNLTTYYLVKEASLKGYKLHNSNYMTFGKRQNQGDSNRIGGCQRLEAGDGREDSRAQRVWAVKPSYLTR